MNLLTIIIIGIIILAGIGFWSTQVEKKANEFKADLTILPTDFALDFKNIKINGGTLRFWGNWFGRPMDNYHEVKNAEFDKETKILKLTLNEDELITVWNPSKIQIGQKELRIKKADKILLEWYSYGAEKTEENFLFDSYTHNGFKIDFSTNLLPEKRVNETNILKPALSLIGF